MKAIIIVTAYVIFLIDWNKFECLLLVNFDHIGLVLIKIYNVMQSFQLQNEFEILVLFLMFECEIIIIIA